MSLNDLEWLKRVIISLFTLYDTIRYCVFNVQLTSSQLSPPHETNIKIKEKTKLTNYI